MMALTCSPEVCGDLTRLGVVRTIGTSVGLSTKRADLPIEKLGHACDLVSRCGALGAPVVFRLEPKRRGSLPPRGRYAVRMSVSAQGDRSSSNESLWPLAEAGPVSEPIPSSGDEALPSPPAVAALSAGDVRSEVASPPAAAPPRRQPLCGELLARFTAQCTHELWERVGRYARKAAARVSELGGIGGDALGEELVQDAFRDTLDGTLRWDPEAASLESHLVSRIRSRARDERRRAREVPLLSLDAQTEADGVESPVLHEAEAMLARQHDDDDRTLRARRRNNRRAVLADDPEAIAILDAIERGYTKKRDILRVTGLTERAYRNARDRFSYLRGRGAASAE